MASLYGPSYSGIYAKELKNIREEQEASQLLIEQEKEEQKMIGGGAMQVGAYIGKSAGKSAARKLEEASQFIIDKELVDVKKYETIAGTDVQKGLFSDPLGETASGLWESATDYLNVDFAGETTQLTSEYISAGIESGAGVSELGIGEITAETLFPDTPERTVTSPWSATGGKEVPQDILSRGDIGEISKWKEANPIVDVYPAEQVLPGDPAATQQIMGTVAGKEVELGTATLTKAADATAGTAAEFTTKLSEAGIKEAAAGSATASAGSIAGTAMAGLGIATGGYQMLTGEDNQTKIAGGLKAVGSGLMLTGAGAPIGLALTGIGTLLDFI